MIPLPRRVFRLDGVPVRVWRTALRDTCRKANVAHGPDTRAKPASVNFRSFIGFGYRRPYHRDELTLKGRLLWRRWARSLSHSSGRCAAPNHREPEALGESLIAVH